MTPERETAESLGIVRGKTVERVDWHASLPIAKCDREGGRIIERINRITTSAGDLLWRCLARHFVEATQ